MSSDRVAAMTEDFSSSTSAVSGCPIDTEAKETEKKLLSVAPSIVPHYKLHRHMKRAERQTEGKVSLPEQSALSLYSKDRGSESDPTEADVKPPLLIKQEPSNTDYTPTQTVQPSAQFNSSNGYYSSEFYSDDSNSKHSFADKSNGERTETPIDFSVKRSNGEPVTYNNGESFSNTAGSDKDVASPESAVTNGIISPDLASHSQWSSNNTALNDNGVSSSSTGPSVPSVSPSLTLPGLPGVINPAAAAALLSGTFPFLMNPGQLSMSASKDAVSNTDNKNPVKTEALPQMPLGYFGMAGLMPGLFPGLDPTKMPTKGMTSEEMLAQCQMYFNKAQEYLKQQEKNVHKHNTPQARRSSDSSDCLNYPSTSSNAQGEFASGSGVTNASPNSTSSGPAVLSSPSSNDCQSPNQQPPHLLPLNMSNLGKLPGTQQRRKPRSLPDEKKDTQYWDRRRKNNAAAKRSRDVRRAKEDEIAIRAAFLEQENLKLKMEVAALKTEIAKLKTTLYST